MSEKLANAAPLGLLGFGLTTVLLKIYHLTLAFFPLESMILAMGLVYGGITQVIVGIMEYRRGNTFGTTTFTSYGLFWLSLVILIVLPNTAVFTGIKTPTGTAMGAYFIMWGIFSFAMFFWDTQSQPSTAIRLHKRDRACIPPRGKRPDGKHSITWKF